MFLNARFGILSTLVTSVLLSKFLVKLDDCCDSLSETYSSSSSAVTVVSTSVDKLEGNCQVEDLRQIMLYEKFD